MGLRFTLTIECDTPSFSSPLFPDASETERYRDALGEVAAMLVNRGQFEKSLYSGERQGRLFDLNGNHCGNWAIRDDDEPARIPAGPGTLAERVAAQRRERAAGCLRRAKLHGVDTPHGRTYALEAARWLLGAEAADAGDTSPIAVVADD